MIATMITNSSPAPDATLNVPSAEFETSPVTSRTVERMDGKTVVRSQKFFDSRLVCEHPWIKDMIAQAVEEGERELAKKRIRKRRAKDRESFHALASALVANAAYALALGLEPPAVGISLVRPSGKRSRYDDDGLSLRSIDAVLSAISPSLVTVTPSRRKGIASVLMPGERLVSGLATLLPGELGVQPWFRLRDGAETIIVQRVERDYAWDTRRTVKIDYEDNSATRRMRSEIARINAAIEAADLTFRGDAYVDTGRRKLRRTFNTYDDAPRFDLNGRLNGGWWEVLEREQRHGIRIDGEPVADLDFSAMFLRLAYADLDIEPPPGDLYANILADAADDDDAAAEGRYREGVKQVVNAMLALTKPLQRLPKGSKQQLPKGNTAGAIRLAVLARHEAIRCQFERGAAARLMHTESDILVAILVRLINVKIVALPMHDGLMVRCDHADPALAAMREVSKELTGFELPTKVTLLGSRS